MASNGASASVYPLGVCVICDTSKKKDDYTTIQWKKFSNNGNRLPKCRDCQQKRYRSKSKKNPSAPDGSTSTTRACSNCSVRKGKEHFYKNRWKAARKGLTRGKCIECLTSDLSVDERLLLLQQNEVKAVQTRACSNCMAHKEREQFYRKKWAAAGKGLAEGKCVECLTSKLSVDQRLLHQNETEAEQSGKKRSHGTDTAGLAKKPRLHTSEDEKAATKSENVDALQNTATVPDAVPSGEAAMPEVTSGTATAVSTVAAAARGRGIDNRPAWMTRGLHSAAAAIFTPATGRGRGRGIDNRPSWMTRGLRGGDRFVGEQRPSSVSAALSAAIPTPYVRDERGVTHMTRSFATFNARTGIDVPIEVHQQIAAQTAAVISGRGTGVENRPPSTTQIQLPVEVRVKHEVHVTHKVEIHAHHEAPNLLRATEEYYSFNQDGSIWV